MHLNLANVTFKKTMNKAELQTLLRWQEINRGSDSEKKQQNLAVDSILNTSPVHLRIATN